MSNEPQSESPSKKIVTLDKVLISNNGEHEVKVRVIADFTNIPEYAEEMMYNRFINVYG
jgi:hypothetical protein